MREREEKGWEEKKIKGDREFSRGKRSREKVVDFQYCSVGVDWEKGNCQDIAHTYFCSR